MEDNYVRNTEEISPEVRIRLHALAEGQKIGFVTGCLTIISGLILVGFIANTLGFVVNIYVGR